VAEWRAEVAVDEGLVRLLVGQFPDLPLESVRLLGEGWDNAVWVVDDEWAFRFPRRAVALAGVQREIAVLPALAPLLPLRVPEPELIGRPADGYPWAFFGARLLRGREAADAGLDDAGRAAVAGELARFLRMLHDLELGADLPEDPNRRADMPLRVAKVREQLDAIERLGVWRRPGDVEGLLAEAERLPAPRRSTVTHGDLHFRHVLVDEDSRVAGVIDWGDVCRADPAIDLQLHWSFLPPPTRAAFLEAYGSVEPEQLLRARVVALSLGAALAAYGHEEGLEAVEREALDGLDRTLID
jgi:aminoglycoside phosphotransferase (APT) family kinase protein